jgi:N-methylhydantoinase A
MPYVIGIDIGGTFTDAVATDEHGVVTGAKTPSTPPDFSQGVIDIVHELAGTLGVSSSNLLSETSYIAHGTTSALNALVTGNVARVGFLTTRGHADSLVIMNLEGRYAGLGPEEIQNLAGTNKPPPLVPKARVREIDERVDYKGEVIAPLDEAQATAAIRELLELEVEAIAVSLLWSFRNAAHEQRVRELIHTLDPNLYVGLSSEISPRIREYPRAATTVMSTQVGPRLAAYLEPLDERLRELGFDGSLLVMQGSGRTIVARDATRNAITTIGSVLTGGAIGAVSLGQRLEHRNIISTDMGGTTFLVGLIVDGKPLNATMSVLNQHTLNVPMVRISTIGAGGGAIAWVDQGGNLRVGPRSAGAHPGPACYGEGGVEPTLTDANLVLGILNPDYFLGGRKPISRELGERAIEEHVGRALEMSVEEAAAAIRAIQDAQTADLVRKVVVNAGHDPREFVLYSFGGAGPCHCAGYAADLEVEEILVPLGPTAAAFSAFGLASSDVGLSAELSAPRNYPIPAAEINAIFEQLEEAVRARLGEQGLDFADVTVQREIDIRYSLQLAEVSTPVRNGRLTDEDVAAVASDFEELYERLFGKGTGFSDAGFQFITYRIHATGHLAFKPELPPVEASASQTPPVKSTRRAFLGPAGGWRDTTVYDYAVLRAGHRLAGPAIVEAPTTTVVVPEGHAAVVDPLGNLALRRNPSEDAGAGHARAGGPFTREASIERSM